ncbi:MAG TPA: methylmalonyl-CoA mutase family protein, partial [Jatrophihabitans sp.]|nr:methylmalonyl-CoA mutase family protein [Jatrophihabitans sp.]
MDSAEQDAPVALAAGFPAADRADWQALVAGVLAKSGMPVPAGRPPEAALAGPGYDGFEIAPLYTAADRPVGWQDGVAGRSPGSDGWDVRARHADPDPRATNQAVLADLTNGVSSLWLVLGPSGLAVADLPAALDGVHLELAPIVLDAGNQAVPAAEALLALAGSTELRGSLGGDPLGWAADTGATPDLDPL